MFIYLFWERERKRSWRRGRERERERERVPPLITQSSSQGMIPQTRKIMTWTKIKRCPALVYFLKWEEALPFSKSCQSLSSLNIEYRRDAWVAQSVKHRLQLRSWPHGSWVRAPHQALCWQLRTWSLLRVLCLLFSLHFPHSCPLFLSLKNKITFEKYRIQDIHSLIKPTSLPKTVSPDYTQPVPYHTQVHIHMHVIAPIYRWEHRC